MTLVAMFARPFLSVRPSCSSDWSPAVTTSLYVVSPPSFAADSGSSVTSTVTGPVTSLSATAWNASTLVSPAAGSAARASPAAPPSSAPTRTIQHRLPPFWKKP